MWGRTKKRKNNKIYDNLYTHPEICGEMLMVML